MDSASLDSIGWRPAFDLQLNPSERFGDDAPTVARIASDHGSHLVCWTEEGEIVVPSQALGPSNASQPNIVQEIRLDPARGPQNPSSPGFDNDFDKEHPSAIPSNRTPQHSGGMVVGDWVLLERETLRILRRLNRESLLMRKSAGTKAKRQLIAANVDTLFIVSSCNHDFSLPRLERYLAMATEARIRPVIVLTKIDLCDDLDPFVRQAALLMTGIVIQAIDARHEDQVQSLFRWCGHGRTVALVGSSGVGKSTLAMTLGAGPLATQAIREDDSKGRHTTTTRSIHRLHGGGMLIDTPGMRELQLAECDHGVETVFQEISDLALQCRFNDCAHDGEPGCAVEDAIQAGTLDPRRLASYRKLQSEQNRNGQSLREQRHESRKQGKFYKSVIAEKKRRRIGK